MGLVNTLLRRTKSGVAAVALLQAALIPGSVDLQQPAWAQSKEPIKIGFMTSLSGSSAADGQTMVNGANLYLDQIGRKMAGRPVELLVENDESNPATGMAKLRKLYDESNADVCAGIILAHIAYPCAGVAEQMQKPLVIAMSGADDITQRQRKKWVIRTSWTSSQISQPMGEYAAKKLGYKKVVTLGSDYPHPWEVVAGFQKTFEENGGKVIQKLWAPLGFKDFKDILKQIRPDADAVFMATVGQSTKIIPKQYKEMGIKIPIIASSTTIEETVFPAVGSDLVGAISSEPYSAAINTPANLKFVQEYKKKYGAEACWYAEAGYTSMMWIDKAVQQMKGDLKDREKFLAALKQVELKNAPRGPVKLDRYGEVVENIYIRKVTKVGDGFENKVVFTYPMVSQFWTWNPEQFLKQPVYSKEYPPCTNCIK